MVWFCVWTVHGSAGRRRIERTRGFQWMSSISTFTASVPTARCCLRMVDKGHFNVVVLRFWRIWRKSRNVSYRVIVCTTMWQRSVLTKDCFGWYVWHWIVRGSCAWSNLHQCSAWTATEATLIFTCWESCVGSSIVRSMAQYFPHKISVWSSLSTLGGNITPIYFVLRTDETTPLILSPWFYLHHRLVPVPKSATLKRTCATLRNGATHTLPACKCGSQVRMGDVLNVPSQCGERYRKLSVIRVFINR